MMTAMFSAMTSVLSPGALLWGWPAQAHSHDPQQHEHQTAAAAAALSHHVTTVTITDANIPTIIAQPQLLDMAPVQFEPEFSYGPAVKAGCHVLGAAYLTFEVGRSLYRAQRGRGPAQDTRRRSARRHALLPVFAGLASLSLLRAIYTAVQYGSLSYKVWASQHDVQVPARFYGDRGVFPPGDKATPLYLFQWLSDTPVYLDAIEILAEKARRFWWGQQVDLSLVSWTMLLAIEGRRRNIPLLWCYQLLGQLVSLSFAQNLFFIALLLTPAPLPVEDASLPVSRYVELRNRIFPPKPSNWQPHPFLFTTIAAANFCIISLIPFLVNTSAVWSFVLISRVLSFTPLVLTYIVPTSWGVVHSHHHKAYRSYERLFRFISAACFFLQTRALLVALAYNAPDAHYHRHAIHLPFDEEQRSAWERTTSAFGRILGATKDHPVVSGKGWDVLLSILSIGFWASVRATDASDILAATIPGFKSQRQSDPTGLEESSLLTQAKEQVLAAAGLNDSSAVEAAGPRRRGRPRKVKTEADETYEPTRSEVAETEVGDELLDAGLEWESAAVVWGLTVLGGLGVGSAGAFGGECVAR